MKCAWQDYIHLLPHRIRQDVDKFGRESLQELRLRLGLPPELILKNEIIRLSDIVTSSDIMFVINNASEYSPWSATTISQGFLSAPGGHRIGICGTCIVNNGKMTGINQPSSLCLRVARDFCGIANNAAKIAESILILGPPGSGKTTFLRDLIRQKSNAGQGSVAVVDEREELFPLIKGQACFHFGMHTDIFSGCSKGTGINMALRCMNPEWIAVDEITAEEDCHALLHAGWCGVKLIATAHAGSVQDYLKRPAYSSLVKGKMFTTVISMQKNKSWKIERICE